MNKAHETKKHPEALESLAQQLQEINERLAAIEKRVENPAVTVSGKETDQGRFK